MTTGMSVCLVIFSLPHSLSFSSLFRFSSSFLTVPMCNAFESIDSVVCGENMPFDLFQTRFVLHKALFSVKVIFYFLVLFVLFLHLLIFSSLKRASGEYVCLQHVYVHLCLDRCLGLKIYSPLGKCVLGG